MYRQADHGDRPEADRQIIIFEVNTEVQNTDIEFAFEEYSMGQVSAKIKGNQRLFAVAICSTHKQFEDILERFGPDGPEKFQIGNILEKLLDMEVIHVEGMTIVFADGLPIRLPSSLQSGLLVKHCKHFSSAYVDGLLRP